MPKETIGLYDPKIPPQRQILAGRADELEAQRGSYRLTRYGEQYVGTCTCCSEVITSDVDEAIGFMNKHKICR